MAIMNSTASALLGMNPQEELMRQRYWLEEQRRMNAGAYYDMNRDTFVIPREQAAVKEAPKLATPDPLAFMDNKANKVLLTQGEM